jgi:TPR repeat protein
VKKIIRVLFVALLSLVHASGWCAPPDDKFDSRYDDSDALSPAFVQTYEDSYFVGKRQEAYEQWLQQAWQGDMYAMATLAAVSVTHTETQWPVPPEFWEHQVPDLLGEAEGSYVLGLQYALIAEAVEKNEAHAAKKKAEDFFLRSALTGHLAGMYCASITAEGREHLPFTPPPLPRVVPVAARFLHDGVSGESRYWLTRAADGGYWKAAAVIGYACEQPEHGPPDYKLAEHYLTIAAENGSMGPAANVGFSYFEQKFHTKSLCESYYNYLFLAGRLENNGSLPRNDISTIVDHIKNNPKGTICLQEKVIAAGTAESKRLYNAWKTRYNEAERKKQELYARAKARIPEVKAAYEQAVRAADKK